MEFFRKNGKFVELGGFGAAFIFMFLPFLTANVLGYTASANLMESPTTAWGIFCLIFILVGIALTVIKYFKPDLLDKLGNAKQPVADFGVLGLAGLILLFLLIAGFSNLEQYVHLGVGFYFMVLAIGAVIASCVIQKFVLKGNGAPVAPVAPVQPQPVMGGQPMPQQPVMNPVPQQPVQPVGQPVNPVPVQPQPMPQQPAINPVPQQPVNNGQPPINPQQ
jgi:hypothetical protein